MHGRLRPWLQLLRVPNLLTVPGDPLAGFILALLGWVDGYDTHLAANLSLAIAAATAVGVSLLLYCAGLVLNDLADFREDLRDRPGRPLPSGRIGKAAAWGLFAVLCAGALALAWSTGTAALAAAGGTLALVVAYDCGAKRVPVLGPAVMGLCRGGSVMIGASVLGWYGLASVPVIAAALIITTYIAAVTAIAAGETTGRAVGRKQNYPGALLAFWFVLLITLVIQLLPGQWEVWACGGLFAAATVYAALCGASLRQAREPAKVSRTIGRFIRNLLLIQAAFCCLGSEIGAGTAVLLLVCWPISKMLGKRFYAS